MKKTPLLLIFLIVFIDLLGFGIVIPILPQYALNEFRISEFEVGLLVSSFSLMQLFFTPLWGRLSDRFGRRPILIFGLVCTVVSYLLFGFAHTVVLLFISRLLGGIGGANISAAQAYIADVTPVEERAKGMGLIGAAFGLGFVFGPVIGGLLSGYGYAIPGFVAAGLSFVALLGAIFLLPESRQHHPDGTASSAFSFAIFARAFRRPVVGLMLVLFFLVTFGYANIYATFPILATREFGYGNHEVGYLFGYLGLIGAITQGGLIRLLSTRFSERALFLFSAACMMIGLAGIPLSTSTFVLHIVLTILALGSGIITPMCLSILSRNADAREQGGILGINQSLGALARTLGPIWGTFAFQAFGHVWPFFTGGIVLAAVLLIAWRSL